MRSSGAPDANFQVRHLARGEVVIGLVAATLVGVLVRGLPVFSADFPLHDGGLFYVMAGDLRAHSFMIPAFTSYNGGSIPFAYPPLALYLAAALNAVGFSLTSILHYAPFLFAAASVPLVFLVVRDLLDERYAIPAAFAFALMPSAYDWIIVGGGITRALGLDLALLTIWLAIRLVQSAQLRFAAAAGITGGLSVLAHPYAAAFSVLTVALVLIWSARNRRVWAGAGAALMIGGIVVTPWIVVVATQHGFGPLLAGSGSRTEVGASLASLLFQDVTGATFSVFLGIALVGFLVEIGRRRFLVPAWLVLTFLFLAGGGLFAGMLPMSILVAITIVEVIVPAVSVLKLPRSPLPVILTGLLGAGLLASLGFGYVIVAPLYPISAAQRQAMSWVSEHSAPNATFMVLTGQTWWLDTTSEWFPALTGHVSVGTAQGYEWTREWTARSKAAGDLQDCVGIGTTDCLAAWIQETDLRPDYVYVAKGPQLGPLSPAECCAAIRKELATTQTTVYDGPGATIYRWSESRLPGGSGRASPARMSTDDRTKGAGLDDPLETATAFEPRPSSVAKPR
jgi:Dolichyl-phosphate-mannose-protein mannosyltransferase